jgi:ABC-2 type transport system permease protein
MLRAEWVKVRTLAANAWLLAGAIVAICAVSILVAAATKCSAASCADPAKVSLTGVYLGQVAIALLGVLAVSGEYANGMIHVTLAAMPRRIPVLAAKAIVLSVVILVAGTIGVLICELVGAPLLVHNGFGHADLPGWHATLRAAGGTVLYLALIGLLSLGVAALVRDAGAAVGIVLGLLFLFPLVAHFTDQNWQRHLAQIAPMTAGLAIQDTVNLASQPIGPWAGLGVLAAWAAAALLIGGTALRCRDALLRNWRVC